MPMPGAAPQAPGDVLFRDLVLTSGRRVPRGRLGLGVSLTTHLALVLPFLLLPLLGQSELPPVAGVHVGLEAPPAAPPPPPPRGSGVVQRSAPVRKPAAASQPDPVAVQLPALPEPAPLPEPSVPPDALAGSPDGSDAGDPDGTDGGQRGGQVGGRLDGKLGGCLTCSGEGPVRDYDQGPRILRQTRPVYPPKAFADKTQGKVVVEILIDSRGAVAEARVVESIPALDQAARECVFQWRFEPARKHGRAVATWALAPVTFSIF